MLFRSTGTSPIQVVIDMGNTSTGGSIVYKPGMTFGNGLFIEKLEFMGKKASNTYVDTTTVETKAVAQQYEIPVHIVASRRLGGFKTTSSTDTSTGVVSTTVGAKPGSETATGGDTLEKTIILRAALSNDNKKIVGCFGQNNALWVAAKAAAAASTNLDIIHKDGGVKIFPEASTINCSTFPNANAAGTKFLLSVCGKMQFTQPTYRSDARYKENIREIPDAASRMEKLRGVKFRWKERSGDDSDQLGFIAQEVQPVFPELVRTGQDDGVMSVSYENLIAPLIEALKQRQKIIQDQERELEELRKSM